MLTLGRNESAWGTRVEDLPPSLSEYTGFGNGTSNSTEKVGRRNLGRLLRERNGFGRLEAEYGVGL